MPNNAPHNMLSAYIAAAKARGEPVFVNQPEDIAKPTETTTILHSPMGEIECGFVGYSGHKFTEDLHVRRDSGHAPGWFIFGRNSEKYGKKPDGKGAYVSLVARPAVKARRHPHYNVQVRRGWRTRREALAALATVQAAI